MYVERMNPVAWALSGLMNVPAEDRARVKAESLRRASQVRLTHRQRFVMLECIDSFTVLDERQVREFEQLVATKTYEKARAMMKTTYERGIEQGIEQGIERGIERGIEQSECSLLLMQIEEKFGSVSQRMQKKIERMTSEERRQLFRRILTAERISDLNT